MTIQYRGESIQYFKTKRKDIKNEKNYNFPWQIFIFILLSNVVTPQIYLETPWRDLSPRLETIHLDGTPTALSLQHAEFEQTVTEGADEFVFLTRNPSMQHCNNHTLSATWARRRMAGHKVCRRQLQLYIAVNSLGPDTQQHSFQMRNCEIDKTQQHQGHADISYNATAGV